ncbi:HORMA domain-containing protein 1 [Gigaspora margarita]|uniref:HORMA domain-containing protein 1 n=2 Tax=Gigaspora margarita TaxID=4874 RepID=A0A8H4APY8_GIGMA|nr:HORMA domain-containing protein 1 [Gigaspora margarita]
MAQSLAQLHPKQRCDTEIVTQTQSLTIVKQLLKTSLSSITYLRGLFPEDNYEDYQVGSLILKHLKRDYSQEANSLLDWLEAGIFDALDHQHLRAVIFGIFLDPKEPNKLVECYTFKVSYPNGEPLLRIENNNGELLTTAGGGHDVTATMREGITVGEIKKSTQQLLRRLILLTQTLKPLPDNRYIVVKLHYYEHVTPADYEPPFFRASNLAEEGFIFNSRPEKIPVGEVDTAYHGINLSIQTISDVLDIEDDSTTDKMLIESNNTIKDFEKSWNAEDDSDSEDDPKVSKVDFLPLKRDQYNERSNRREMSVISNAPALTSRSMSKDKREMSIVSNVPALTSRSMSRDRREMSIVSNVSTLTSAKVYDKNETMTHSNRVSMSHNSISRNGSITQPTDHSHSNNVVASRASQLRTYSTQRHSHSSPLQDVFNETIHVPVNSQNSPVIIDDDESSSNESVNNTHNYKCDCGVNIRDGDMINCVKCDTWGHVPCYGYKSLDDSRMSNHHTCYQCLRNENNNLWELDALMDLALFRRSLWIIWKEGIPSTCRQFAQRLGVKFPCARQLQTRLKTEGFIAPPPKPSKRKGKAVVGSNTSNSNNSYEVIKTDENIHKMNDYFNPDIGLMPVCSENIDVEVDFHEENNDTLQKTTSEFVTKENSSPALSQEFIPMDISFESSAPASQVTNMEPDQTNVQSALSSLENTISHNESEKSDDGHRKHKLHDKNSTDVDANEDDQDLKKRKVSISIGHIAVL